MLENQLKQMGYDVLTASNGIEAWDIVQLGLVNFMITDWLMPELNGVDLCRKIRQSEMERYVYIILLTSKGDKNDLIQGMEAGADDFIVKPYLPSELKVRVRAGERVLQYEQTLVDQKRRLEETFSELSHTYDVIKGNLNLAGKLQKALLPPNSTIRDTIFFESFFIPCEIVAGDVFNFFPYSEDQIIFYLLDVAGHGIPAAMLSFTLSHMITPMPYTGKVLNPVNRETLYLDFGDPVKLATNLNQWFQGRPEGQLYFTMIYGIIDLAQKKIRFTQAGHPPLIYLPRGGTPKAVGDGGFPLGLFPNLSFDVYELDFRPGDRIFVYSDGVTECFNKEKTPYSMERLMSMVSKTRHISLRESLNLVQKDVQNWRQAKNFEDDLSLLAIEFNPEAGY